jgi:hypothetical protein
MHGLLFNMKLTNVVLFVNYVMHDIPVIPALLIISIRPPFMMSLLAFYIS